MKVYRIELSYACFGIGVQDGKVIKKDTAPIGRWMIGKDLSFIHSWVQKKNGKIEELTNARST